MCNIEQHFNVEVNETEKKPLLCVCKVRVAIECNRKIHCNNLPA